VVSTLGDWNWYAFLVIFWLKMIFGKVDTDGTLSSSGGP
jgi:hypothetical protein